tara:strand:+ start:72 stop:281 length:210 start_codon:yes stop_codon:yes gene_type:complete
MTLLKPLRRESLTDQVDSALNDLFNLDSLTAQIKSVVSGHEHTQELLVTLQATEPEPAQVIVAPPTPTV